MSFCFKKKALLVVLIALTATALAKSANLRLHVNNSSHGTWKLITEVF